MNIEEVIKNCEIYLEQIKQYDPDPFYVNYFFTKFIDSVNASFRGIFEEANKDFGLFITENVSQKNFYEKSIMRDDKNAIDFSNWYSMNFNKEHEFPYPNIIKKICTFKNNFQKLPEIKVMIRASERYKGDIYQQIKINLSNEKLRSKEELGIEIKRQLPVFLEIINHKRNKNNEPKVDGSQIIASAFLDIEEHKNIEIVYAAEIYIPVMKRVVEQSRMKIRELTTWK